MNEKISLKDRITLQAYIITERSLPANGFFAIHGNFGIGGGAGWIGTVQGATNPLIFLLPLRTFPSNTTTALGSDLNLYFSLR